MSRFDTIEISQEHFHSIVKLKERSDELEADNGRLRQRVDALEAELGDANDSCAAERRALGDQVLRLTVDLQSETLQKKELETQMRDLERDNARYSSLEAECNAAIRKLKDDLAKSEGEKVRLHMTNRKLEAKVDSMAAQLSKSNSVASMTKHKSLRSEIAHHSAHNLCGDLPLERQMIAGSSQANLANIQQEDMMTRSVLLTSQKQYDSVSNATCNSSSAGPQAQQHFDAIAPSESTFHCSTTELLDTIRYLEEQNSRFAAKTYLRGIALFTFLAAMAFLLPEY